MGVWHKFTRKPGGLLEAVGGPPGTGLPVAIAWFNRRQTRFEAKKVRHLQPCRLKDNLAMKHSLFSAQS